MSHKTNTSAVASWGELLENNRLPTLLVLSFGVWLHAADATLVATLLPTAVQDIGGGNYLHWTMVVYNVSSILAGAISLVIARRTELRFALIGSASVYGVGCVISAIGPTMVEMLIGRVIQGLGGGALVALTLVTAHDRFDDRLRPRLLALISAVWGAASFLGPLSGGVFAALGMWRLGFWCFATQGLIYLIAVAIVFPSDRTATSETDQHQTAPVARLLVFALAAMMLASAGVSVTLPLTPLLLGLGGLIFWLFIRADARAGENRLFPQAFMNPSGIVGAGILGIMALSAASIAFTLYGPIILLHTQGIGPLSAGYLIALESVAWSVAAVFVSGISGTRANTAILIGASLVAISPLSFAVAVPNDMIWLILITLVVQGGGFGLCFAPIVQVILVNAPMSDRDRASAALTPLQTIGYTVGAALCGLFVNSTGFGAEIAADTARVGALWLFLGSLPLGAIGIWSVWCLINQVGHNTSNT